MTGQRAICEVIIGLDRDLLRRKNYQPAPDLVDQRRQLPHLVECSRRTGAAKGRGGARPAVAAAVKSEHGHVRSARGDNPGNAVLDHQAPRWRNPHLRRREQKQIRLLYDLSSSSGTQYSSSRWSTSL
jgi:hypothetical protein